MGRKRSFAMLTDPSSASPSEDGESLSEDGNADLSLDILAKADSRRLDNQTAQSHLPPSSSKNALFLNGILLDSDVELLSSDTERNGGGNWQARGREVVSVATESGKDVGEDARERDLHNATSKNLIQITDDSKKNKKKKNKKKKAASRSSGPAGNFEKDLLFKAVADDAEDNLIMRKLLRGPRYFNQPEEQACLCCGNVGHLAAACTEEPRKRRCYICGDLGHEGKDCPQGCCFICKSMGHFAKSCPNKGIQVVNDRISTKICLHCGDTGHDTSICRRGYTAEDLKVVQCYVCKGFGHLCCLDIVDTSSRPISCYNCGELGHTGVGCAKSRVASKDDDRQRAKVCYKCGEEGHFARGCAKPDELDHWWPDPQTPDMRKSHSGNDFLGFRSVPSKVEAYSHRADVQFEGRRSRTLGVSSWPARWNMETEGMVNSGGNGKNSWGSIKDNNRAMTQVKHHTADGFGSGHFQKRQRHSAGKADRYHGRQISTSGIDYATPGNSKRYAKKNHHDQGFHWSDAGKKKFLLAEY